MVTLHDRLLAYIEQVLRALTPAGIERNLTALGNIVRDRPSPRSRHTIERRQE